MRILAAFVVMAGLAGCLSDDTEVDPDSPVGGMSERLFAHDASGPIDVPSAARSFHVESFPMDMYRGEPTVGVTSDGVLFATGSGPLREVVPGGEGLVARSVDGGKSWEVVRDLVNNAPTDTDPWLWVDPVTDRVWNVPLWVGCSWITWSDDRGDSWSGHPFAGCPVLPGHDHQKLTSGPYPDGVTGSYDTVVYYAYNSFRLFTDAIEQDGTHVAVSMDGGLTWAPSVRATPSDECHGGLNGPVDVSDDGIAYLAKPACDGPRVSRSMDAGASWELMPVVEGVGMIDGLATIHAAVDDAGTVYLLWSGSDYHFYYAYSTDQGASWSEPFEVTPPHVNSVVFGAFDAGAAGKLGIMYIGTDVENAQFEAGAPASQVWHAYAAIVDGADTVAPTVVTQQVTPDDDPVERGCIRGSLDEPCRNLRDFIDVQVRDGRMVGVYADGCRACAEDDSDRLPRGETVVAIMQSGPSLQDGSPLVPFEGQR